MDNLKKAVGRCLAVLPKKAEDLLNNIGLKWKLLLMYVCCVMIPLIVSDSAVVCIILQADFTARRQEMNNTAEAIAYSLQTEVDNAVNLTQVIYRNRYVNEFMEGSYSAPLEYYNAYIGLLKDSLYETGLGANGYKTVIYADNPGFVNGGYFAGLALAQDTQWYRALQEGNNDIMVLAHFEKTQDEYQRQRKISVIRWMDYYHKGLHKNVLRMDLDYSALNRDIINARYNFNIYVCDSDKILFSNSGTEGVWKMYEPSGENLYKEAAVCRNINLYGQEWDILVMDSAVSALDVILDNMVLVAVLLCVNILLPALFMVGMNRSFTLRLRELGDVFEKSDEEFLAKIAEPKGKDEIGVLMRSYSNMADRINELIQTVYKDKLKEQEIDIARQQAELLALHSQINPHFLFNALESIRMHSLLKGEDETADMVEKLAMMQRQNVDWGDDCVPLSEELKFVEAYLELQKYRFGSRLSYRIEMEAKCGGVQIPKLTLVTFVENACVHGMEKKTAAGWIFVRCYRRQEQLFLEVEDTGNGMTPLEAAALQDKMNGAQIGQLRKKGRVGVLNVCLRLKMAMNGQVHFELESEEGAGLLVLIRMPFDVNQGGWTENAESIVGG